MTRDESIELLLTRIEKVPPSPQFWTTNGFDRDNWVKKEFLKPDDYIQAFSLRPKGSER